MSIRPVDLNGVTMRAQDMSTLKQNEDNKPFLQQNDIQIEHDKHEEQQTRQVHDADDAKNKESRFDAKEKGSNEYETQQNKKKKNAKEIKKDDQVIVKNEGMKFDIRI